MCFQWNFFGLHFFGVLGARASSWICDFSFEVTFSDKFITVLGVMFQSAGWGFAGSGLDCCFESFLWYRACLLIGMLRAYC